MSEWKKLFTVSSLIFALQEVKWWAIWSDEDEDFEDENFKELLFTIMDNLNSLHKAGILPLNIYKKHMDRYDEMMMAYKKFLKSKSSKDKKKMKETLFELSNKIVRGIGIYFKHKALIEEAMGKHKGGKK